MPPCRCAASPLRGDHRCDFSLTRQLCRSFREWSFAAASSLQLEGAVTGLEPLSRGGPAGPGLPLWAGGWVQIFLKAERQSFRQPSRRAALRWKEQSVVQSPQQWGRGRRPQGHRYGRGVGFDKQPKAQQFKTKKDSLYLLNCSSKSRQ